MASESRSQPLSVPPPLQSWAEEHAQSEPPDEQREQEPRDDWDLGMEELEWPFLDREAVQLHRDQQVDVVEQLEDEIGGEQLAERSHAALVPLCW